MPPCLATIAPAGGGDDRRERRDIIGAGSVAARADDVDGARRRLDRRHGGAHRLRRADDLLDRLAAHPQPHEKAPSCAGVAAPSKISAKAARASSRASGAPETRAAM